MVRYPTVIAILDVVDTFCIVYFTLEYVVRFMCAPKKLRFILQPMNQACSRSSQSVDTNPRKNFSTHMEDMLLAKVH